MPDEAARGPYSDAYFAAVGAGSLASARTVLREIFGLLGTPATVVDVGCGTGTWLRAAAELGAGPALGIDGDWVPRDRLEIPEDRFVACELSRDGVPARAGVSGPFDLVMSLEVGEHLPGGRADAFVAELCGLGGDAVLFSAAMPHQGGVDHLNEAWPMAWGALFEARGFRCFDALRPRVWLSPEVDWWYAQNVLVFARDGAAERLRRAPPPSPVPLPLVHPRRWAAQAEVEAGLRAALGEARRAAEASRAEALRLAGAEAALQDEVRALRGSRSWRATAPARKVAELLRRGPGGPRGAAAPRARAPSSAVDSPGAAADGAARGGGERRMDGDPIHRWVAAVAPGHSFVDIGGIGERSKHERVSQALAAGAARVAVADIEPAGSEPWRFFHDTMAARGIPRGAYESHAGVEITRPDLAERLPASEVVHCTGILYHCPDPVTALHNLRRVTGRWLIVNTVVCPQWVENAAGALALPNGAALFLPGLSEAERNVLRLHYRTKFGWDLDATAPRPRAEGAVAPHLTPDGRLSCWPYWWLFTAEAFRALLRLLRFDVRDEWTWEDHALSTLCERTG